MIPQPKREEPHPVEAMDSPGKSLRIARQAKGLDQDRVAAQLHLSRAMIRAIEHDDYAALPGPVFVRGYLRNYARLLGLDETTLLQAYSNLQPEAATETPLVRARIKSEIHSSHLAIRLVSWLLVIGLIVLLAIWMQGRLDFQWSDLAPGTRSLDTPESRWLLPDALDSSSPSDDETAANPGNLATGTGGEVNAIPPEEPPAAVPEEGPDKSSPPPTDDRQPPPVMGMAANLSPIETTLADGQERGPAPSVPADSGTADASSGVVFEFLGNCWVDVRDSTRKFKLFGEMRKGDRQRLQGTPPYSVILGNSPMVKITVNDKRFDLESHSRGNVARFTLDPEALD